MFSGQLVAEHGYEEDADNGGILPPMDNIFSLVAESGGKSALYTSKEKFDLLRRSWPIDRYLYLKRAHMLVPQALEEMKMNDYKYVFLHIRSPDRAGHKMKGAKNAIYDEAVAEADNYLGEVRMLIESDPRLKGNTAIVLTADHGFADTGNHADEAFEQNYRIPFCSWGPGVKAGGDLYDINVPKGIIINPHGERGDTLKVIRNAYAGVLSADWLGLYPQTTSGWRSSGSIGAMANQYLAVSDEVKVVSTPTPTSASPTSTPTVSSSSSPTFAPTTATPVATPTTITDAPVTSPVASPVAAPIAAPAAAPVSAPSQNVATNSTALNRAEQQSTDVYLLDGATFGQNNPEKTYNFDEIGFILVNHSPRLDAILRFELPPGADESNILGATLEVETLYGVDPVDFLVYQGISNDWDAATVNWSNVPDLEDAGNPIGTFEATEQTSISRATLENVIPIYGHIVLRIVGWVGQNGTYSALSTNAKLTVQYSF